MTSISVLIPTHQRPELLAHAINSVRHQTRPADQIIVVHDGTNSVRPADLSGVTYAEISKAGLSAAVNRAFDLSTGDYVTVLADDDVMYEWKLATLAALLDREPDADVAFGLAVTIDVHGVPCGVQSSTHRWCRDNPLVTWATVQRRRGLRIHGTATLYRRASWVKAGPWDDTLPVAEEWEYHLRLLSTGARFRFVDVITDAYRIHDQQKSGRRTRRSLMRKLTLERINARYASLLDPPKEADHVVA